MPDREPVAGHSARLLRGLIWTGVVLAPLAAIIVLLGGSSAVRFAVLLMAVSVVLVGASVLIRNDPSLQRMDVEDRVAEEVAVLRRELRAEFGQPGPGLGPKEPAYFRDQGAPPDDSFPMDPVPEPAFGGGGGRAVVPPAAPPMPMRPAPGPGPAPRSPGMPPRREPGTVSGGRPAGAPAPMGAGPMGAGTMGAGPRGAAPPMNATAPMAAVGPMGGPAPLGGPASMGGPAQMGAAAPMGAGPIGAAAPMGAQPPMGAAAAVPPQPRQRGAAAVPPAPPAPPQQRAAAARPGSTEYGRPEPPAAEGYDDFGGEPSGEVYGTTYGTTYGGGGDYGHDGYYDQYDQSGDLYEGGYTESNDYASTSGYDGPAKPVSGDPNYRAKRHRPSANDTNVGSLEDFAEYGGYNRFTQPRSEERYGRW